MTINQARAVKLYKSGMSIPKIAQEIGVTRQAAHFMILRAAALDKSFMYNGRLQKCVYPAIARVMHEREITIQALSEQIGINKASVGRALHGESIRYSTACKIADALGMTVDEAFRRDEKTREC